MTYEVVMAGFGGQGVMLMGQLLAYAGMVHGKQVSWMPSYGPEMRGGTANCTVIVADEVVGSPVVAQPYAVVALNRPSLDKFEGAVRKGGVLIYNESLISTPPTRSDITVVPVAANHIANELGNVKVANMVALGALLKVIDLVPMDCVVTALKKALPAHRQDMVAVNLAAIERGQQAAEK